VSCRRAVALAIALVAVCSVATPARADVDETNWLAGGILGGGDLAFFDYASGTPLSAPADTAFSAGSFLNTRDDLVPGSLTLDHYGSTLPDGSEPWWDTDWQSRRCVDLDHTAAGASTVTEYQVKVVLDTQDLIADGEFDPDAQDLRAVRDNGGFVNLDLWVEPGTLNTIATVVWVKVDQITAAATTDFCLYWNNPNVVASVSSEAAVFTYSAAQTVYYTVSDTYGVGTDGVDVASYVDGNSISLDGGAPVVVDDGDVASFTGNGPDSAYAVTGPIAGVGTSDQQDSLVPAAFAGTLFVVPTNRDGGTGQSFSVRSPWANADIEVYDGTTLDAGPTTVQPADGTVTFAGDTTGSATAIVRSTNGVPFLLTHHADNGDAIVAVPAATEDLFGMQSADAHVGYGGSGATATVDFSDGSQSPVGGDEDIRSSFTGATGNGDGLAARVTDLTVGSGAIQQEDGDGTEATMFWPGSELASRYLVPVDTEYVSVACPVSGTQLSIAGGAPVACSGATFGADFIGKAYSDNAGAGWTTGGTTAISVASTGGEPFWLMFDKGAGTGADDESQVTGMRHARQVTYPAPQLSARPEEGFYKAAGVWDSAPVDTGVDGVYGLIRWIDSLPAGTSVAFQVASGPTQMASLLAPFVGPDGTNGTSFTTPRVPVHYDHDGHRWFRLRALLATTDPSVTPEVSSITLDTDLGAFAATVDSPNVVNVTSPAGTPTRTWIARVRTGSASLAGSDATIRNGGPPSVPNLDAAVVAFHRPDSNQVIVADLGSGGEVTQDVGPPVTFGPADPHSIVLDTTNGGGATDLDVTWGALISGTGPIIEHRFRFAITG
jgi:hypothetical protein